MKTVTIKPKEKDKKGFIVVLIALFLFINTRVHIGAKYLVLKGLKIGFDGTFIKGWISGFGVFEEKKTMIPFTKTIFYVEPKCESVVKYGSKIFI